MSIYAVHKATIYIIIAILIVVIALIKLLAMRIRATRKIVVQLRLLIAEAEKGKIIRK